MLANLTGYYFDTRSRRYVDAVTGRFVASATVRDALEAVIENAQANMHLVSQRLLDGEITLTDWQTEMMRWIKQSHVASAAAGNGGWGNMSQADWGATGRLIRDQYDYLRNFASEIASGQQPLDGRLLVRADMYGQASRGTFEEIHRRGMIAAGYDIARRVLGAADHCEDCLEYAEEGYMPAEDVPPIGDSACLTRCHCSIEYAKSSELESEIL